MFAVLATLGTTTIPAACCAINTLKDVKTMVNLLFDASFVFESLSIDLVWLRGFNITHFLVLVAFYLLWRLPGHHRSSGGDEVWYDAFQTLPPEPCESDVSDGSDNDWISPEDHLWLQSQVPDSTEAERVRFLVAKGNRTKAAQALKVYTHWRLQHNISVTMPPNSNKLTEDERIWTQASLIALKVRKEKRCDRPLPKIVHLHERGDNTSNAGEDDTWIRDKTGRRILHFLPGRMDDRLASTVTYALAVALYVNMRLSRHSQELVTVVIDTRGGTGWRNLNAAQLLPFIQHLSKLMLTLFPQRLYRALVFPIPATFFWVWRIARNCIDLATREKICPLMGPSTIDSPPPMDQIAEYLGIDNALLLESKRKEEFLSSS